MPKILLDGFSVYELAIENFDAYFGSQGPFTIRGEEMAYDAEKWKERWQGLPQQDIFWPHRQRFFETVFCLVPPL